MEIRNNFLIQISAESLLKLSLNSHEMMNKRINITLIFYK